MNKKLSVIIPFVNEYPQVMWTIRSIVQELEGRVDFEIIAVNNFCKQVEDQRKHIVNSSAKASGITDGQTNKLLELMGISFVEDKSGESISSAVRLNNWLKYIHYDKKLSHWQAKNEAVKAATGDILWFCDSHCALSRDSLYNMYKFYCDNHSEINGSIHLPLTYKIMESRRLIYKLVWAKDKHELTYSFTEFKQSEKPYKVPCMSCCGVMITRDVYNKFGGWPTELGIYGGGEQFFNFALSVLGMNKWIWPEGYLYHHGEKRGYHYLYDDYVRNRLIAAFCYGGHDWAKQTSLHIKGRQEVIQEILLDVYKNCHEHRNCIAEHQEIDIADWIGLNTNKGEDK